MHRAGIGDFEVGNRACKGLTSFKYLVWMVNARGKDETDEKKRSQETRTVTCMLHPDIWNTVLSDENKSHLHQRMTVTERIGKRRLKWFGDGRGGPHRRWPRRALV